MGGHGRFSLSRFQDPRYGDAIRERRASEGQGELVRIVREAPEGLLEALERYPCHTPRGLMDVEEALQEFSRIHPELYLQTFVIDERWRDLPEGVELPGLGRILTDVAKKHGHRAAAELAEDLATSWPAGEGVFVWQTEERGALDHAALYERAGVEFVRAAAEARGRDQDRLLRSARRVYSSALELLVDGKSPTATRAIVRIDRALSKIDQALSPVTSRRTRVVARAPAAASPGVERSGTDIETPDDPGTDGVLRLAPTPRSGVTPFAGQTRRSV